MKNWKSAVDKFLKSWEDKDEIIAVLACGSYVTGNPTEHSDVDLHLILSKKVNWKERGNKIVDGILIEYFANPANELEKYFKEDHSDYSYSSPTMFLTGEVIWDKEEILQELKSIAKSYKEKELPKLVDTTVELKKYSLWDHLDNLQNSFQEDDPDFYYIYYIVLNYVYDAYAKYLQYPVSETSKVYDTLTKESSRRKYLLQPFPDEKFVHLFSKAMIRDEKDKMMKEIEELIQYTLAMMGGFIIDGWKIRSSCTSS